VMAFHTRSMGAPIRVELVISSRVAGIVFLLLTADRRLLRLPVTLLVVVLDHGRRRDRLCAFHRSAGLPLTGLDVFVHALLFGADTRKMFLLGHGGHLLVRPGTVARTD
jgi:hypothetical protein